MPPIASPVDPAFIGPYARITYAPTGNQPGARGSYFFHRLERTTARARWWRPLATIALFMLGTLTAMFILTLVALPFFSEEDFATLKSGQIPADSLSMLYFEFGLIAILIVPLLLAQLLNTRARYGQLFSVAGKIRWKWLFTTLLIAVAIFLVQLVVAYFVDGLEFRTDYSPGQVVAIIFFLLVLVPLQCTAEELIFRGLVMQTIGQWVKYPIVAILVQTILFVGAHGYGVWGAMSVGMMALVSGWMAIQTGGLEAGISLHIANNWSALITTMLVGGTLDATATGSVLDVVIVFVVFALFVTFVELLRRRQQLPNAYHIEVPKLVEVPAKQVPPFTPLNAVIPPFGTLMSMPAVAVALEYFPRPGVILPQLPATASTPVTKR